MFWKTCALVLLAAPAIAGGIDVHVEDFTNEFGVYRVTIAVVNNTSRTQENIYVDCVIFDDAKRAIGIANANIPLMYPASKRYETATLATNQRGETTSCHVVD